MGEQKKSGSRGSAPSLGGLAERRSDPPTPGAPFSEIPPIPETLVPSAIPRQRSGTMSAIIVDRSFDEGPNLETLRGIRSRIVDYDLKRDEHEKWIREALSSLDPVSINNLRYKLFAPHYDKHMVGHERSIRYLLRQLVEVERTAFSGEQLLGGDILEMSCGTGTVVKLISEAVGHGRSLGLNFVANDISPDMMSLAREKLSVLEAGVEFSSQDISALSFPRSAFRSIFLAQTVHLITDPEVVAQERASGYMHIDSERHLEAKAQVITSAWDCLANGGLFVIIDEWPALLSDRGGPLGAGFAYLFNDGLRAVDLDVLQSTIMQNLGGSKFVAQLKVPIDAQHHMHLLAYRKEEKKPHSRIPPSPDFDSFRDRASELVMETLKATDPAFIQGMQPTDGSSPWVNLYPLNDNHLVVRGGTEIEADRESCRSIVLDRCMHSLDTYDRFDLISEAVRSLSVGGSLIIIDEWNAPEGSERSMRLDALSGSLMRRFKKNMVFASSVRVPIHGSYGSGMYGFEYRKVI